MIKITIDDIANDHAGTAIKVNELMDVIDSLTNIVERQENIIADKSRLIKWLKENAS